MASEATGPSTPTTIAWSSRRVRRGCGRSATTAARPRRRRTSPPWLAQARRAARSVEPGGDLRNGRAGERLENEGPGYAAPDVHTLGRGGVDAENGRRGVVVRDPSGHKQRQHSQEA